MSDRYYTTDVAAAAASADVAPSTVYRWISQGRLTSFEHNHVTYLSLDELEELAALRDTHGRLPSRRLHSQAE